MSEKTKIVVIHMKELLYTVIFTSLVIVLIVVLVYMFLPKNKNGQKSVQTEQPATAASAAPQATEESLF